MSFLLLFKGKVQRAHVRTFCLFVCDLRSDLQPGGTCENCRMSVGMKRQTPDRQASSSGTKQTLHPRQGHTGGRCSDLYVNNLLWQQPAHPLKINTSTCNQGPKCPHKHKHNSSQEVLIRNSNNNNNKPPCRSMTEQKHSQGSYSHFLLVRDNKASPAYQLLLSFYSYHDMNRRI